MNHLAIQIRDAIANAIANTAYSIHTARSTPLEEDELPAVLVMLGPAVIDQDQMDPTEAESQQQDYLLRVYASSGGDVDAVLYDAIKNIEEALAADPQLTGLADDSFHIERSEPDYEEGTKKFIFCEVAYRVLYSTPSTTQ